MIPALGAGGRGFDSRITPFLSNQLWGRTVQFLAFWGASLEERTFPNSYKLGL